MNLVQLIIGILWFATITSTRQIPNSRIDIEIQTKLSSSLRRMRRDMKREFRTKLIPKIVRSVLNDLNEDVGGRIQPLALTVDMLKLKMGELEQRIDVLDEQNLSLQKKLDFQASDLKEFRANVFLNCGCDLGDSNETVTDYSMNLSGISTSLSNVNASAATVAVGASKDMPIIADDTGLTTSTPVEYSANVTFSVSSKMPNFENEDSLLVVNDKGRLTRISLKDPEVRGELLTEKHIECIAYDPNSRTVFWSRNQRRHTDINNVYNVFSANLNGSNVRTLLGGKWIVSMVIDGNTGQVFMAVWYHDHVSVMSTRGENYRVIRNNFTISGSPKNLILDTVNKKVYVSFSSDIFVMAYDGSGLQRLVKGSWMKPMALDPVNGVLYFSDRANLYSFQLDRKQKDLVYQMKHSMNALVLHDDMLYVAYQKANVAVDMIFLREKTVRAFTYLTGEWFRLCLIPAAA